MVAEQPAVGGLLFYSYYDKENFTRLDLTPEIPITLRGSFTFSFDFYIWKTRPFGYLLNGYDDQRSLFVFSFVDYQNPDTSYFTLTVNDQHEQIRIGIPNGELHRNRWHQAELHFDMKAQKADLTLDDRMAHLDLVDFPSTLHLKLKFGGVTLGGDTPNMAVRDIILKNGSGKPSFPAVRG